MRMTTAGVFTLTLAFSSIPELVAAPPKPSQAVEPGIAFFEAKIRPVLVEQCYSCHSEQSKRGPKGGLRVDTREALLLGGDSGPAVVPKKVTASWLIKALHGDEVSEMPPNGKLPSAVIADFEKWVAMGAPDPRIADKPVARASGIDIAAGQTFWAYQPPRAHPAPVVTQADWPRSDVDRFILHALEAKQLQPSPDADRSTLIRRLTFDLHGLLPTPAEVAAFVADSATDDVALAKVVDRLLASPRFGERWGRHWLDVARYADSNGKDENLTFHEAYLYRDWVIQQFNVDTPYDRFVREQIAGDLLPARDDKQRDAQLTATGFLVIGPKVLADRDLEKRRADVIDEQIDTIGRAFLGQTLGCVRCHDHKFDPIPQSDYYALAGILGSTRTLDRYKLGNPIVAGWMLRPLGGEAGEKQLAVFREYEQQLKELTSQIKSAKAELTRVETATTMRQPGALVGFTVDNTQAKLIGNWKPSTYSSPFVGEGYVHDDKTDKGKKSATFTPKLPRDGEYEVLISFTAGSGRAHNVPVTIQHVNGEKQLILDQTRKPKIDGLFAPIGTFSFAAGTSGSATITTQGTTGYVIVDAVRFVPKGELANVPEAAMGVSEELQKKLAQAAKRVKALEAKQTQLKKSAPKPPQMVMASRDEDVIADAKIHVRGNPHQLGNTVPRGFLQVATADPMPTIPAGQSGRVQLAEWLGSRSNPLTAKVYVNRVWYHLFGEGLVRTVDEFTRQGERPTHPALLDTLAVEFMNHQWSTKQLIRKLVLSRVYRLATRSDATQRSADPENRLLSHAHRRRMEAEVIRDGILQIAGNINFQGGGPVVAHMPERAITNNSDGGVSTEKVTTRSVYLPIIRNELAPILEVFDFADPTTSTGQRDETTVPTQALFLMNNPFIIQQAQVAAHRLLAASSQDAERITLLYQLAYSRQPTSDELTTARGFLAEYQERLASVGSDKAPKNRVAAAWAALCQAVFGSTEFRFIE
ncbi:MAG: DUF1553 domain-containing protein [Bacteroidales bacterium]|nr:DUF1553 domain-containing protein [Bacteroidales bacterium]